ncbi:hypothetical protein CYG49_01350 [Candidatus Saccharibacteria bacterium]|nr:MAG: hypothetical protein CYG49_01350 [Candidatus Saccharibacteria bacterium]
MLPLEPKDKNKVTPSEEPLLTSGGAEEPIPQQERQDDVPEPQQYETPPAFAAFDDLVKEEERKDAEVAAAAGSATGTTPTTVSPLPETIFAAANQDTGSSKRKKIILGVIAGVLILLLASAAAAYAYFNSSDKVLGDALTKTMTANSLATKGTYTYKSKEAGEGDLHVDFDIKSGENRWVQADISAKTTVEERSFKVDSSFIFAAKEDVYFKITNVKDLLLGIFSDGTEANEQEIDQFLSPLAAKVNNKWIKIPKEDLNDTNPEAAEIDECAAKLDSEIKNNPELTKGVREAYNENSFLVVTEKLPSEQVNGAQSLHYKLKVDEGKLKNFEGDFKQTDLYKRIKDCSKNEEVFKFDDEFYEDASKSTYEVWINKWTHEFTRIAANGPTENGNYTIKSDLTFNKTVTIEIPKDSTPIKEIIQEVQQLFLGGMSPEAPRTDDELPLSDGTTNTRRIN